MKQSQELQNDPRHDAANRKSAADADLAETQEDAPAAHRTPETQLGAEAREQENLIELAPDRGVTRSRKNVVEENLALGI